MVVAAVVALRVHGVLEEVTQRAWEVGPDEGELGVQRHHWTSSGAPGGRNNGMGEVRDKNCVATHVMLQADFLWCTKAGLGTGATQCACPLEDACRRALGAQLRDA